MYVSEGSADGRGRWESATRSEFGSPFYHARAGLASRSCLACRAWHDASFRLARSLQYDIRTKTLAGVCHPRRSKRTAVAGSAYQVIGAGGFRLRSHRGRWVPPAESSGPVGSRREGRGNPPPRGAFPHRCVGPNWVTLVRIRAITDLQCRLLVRWAIRPVARQPAALGARGNGQRPGRQTERRW